MNNKNSKLFRNLVLIAIISSVIMLIINYTDQRRSLQTQNPALIGEIISSQGQITVKNENEILLSENAKILSRIGNYDWLYIFELSELSIHRDQVLPRVILKTGRILFSLKKSAFLRAFEVGTDSSNALVIAGSESPAIAELLFNERGRWELRCYQGKIDILGPNYTKTIKAGEFLLETEEATAINKERSNAVAALVENIRKEVESSRD